MKNIYLFLVLILAGACGSGKIVPTSDVCSIEKHYKDNVFQVKINGKPINTHWYIHDEALDITRRLAKENKCMGD